MLKSVFMTWFFIESKPFVGVPIKQVLLQISVSGAVRPGELLAIMGASGAGKSTMLNALTLRNLSGLDVQGEVEANGVPITSTMVTSLSAYIQQDDMFIGILTVKEQLEFQAKLRDGRWFAQRSLIFAIFFS